MDNESLEVIKKVQSIEIELLDEMDRVCKANGIPYLLYAGTLIGAVRHSGFIPWDDDIDIAMLREDFEKFRELYPLQKGNSYCFQEYQSDPNYPDGNLHIRKLGTVYATDTMLRYKSESYGVFLDIWPLDNYNSLNENAERKRLRRVRMIQSISSYRACTNCQGYNLKRKLFYYCSKVFSLKHLCLKREAICTSNSEKTGELTNFLTKYQFGREIFKYDDLFPTKTLLFEGKEYSVPKEYKKVLSIMYGDYMKLPPVEEQEQLYHKPEKIEL